VAVGQGEEDDVVAGKGLGGGFGEDPVSERGQVRVVLAEPGPGVAARGECPDLNVGVGEQEAQQFPSYVPAGAGDRRRIAHTSLPLSRVRRAPSCTRLKNYAT